MQPPPTSIIPDYNDMFQMYRAYEALDAEDPPNFHDRRSGDKKWTTKQGVLHRDNDRPAVMRFHTPMLKMEFQMRWYQNGNRHRDGDKPADILITREQVFDYTTQNYTNVVRISMLWGQNGIQCRDNDKPAVEDYTFKNGILTKWRFAWYKNGVLHRQFKPAVMISRPDGDKEEYWLNGKRVSPYKEAYIAAWALKETGALPDDMNRYIGGFVDEDLALARNKEIAKQREAGVAAHHDKLYKEPQQEMDHKYKYYNAQTKTQKSATAKKETKAGGRFPKRGKYTSRRMKRIKRKSSLKRKK